MKYISTIIFLAMFSTTLHASYLRTIRVTSFATEKQAQESLVNLKEYVNKHENIRKLQEKYKFKLKARVSGNHYITLIEPLTSRIVLQEVLDTLRLEYKDVYVTKLYLLEKKEIIDKTKPSIEIKEYYENGDLKSSAIMIDKMRNGLYTEYYKNGKIKYLIDYKNDKMHGKKKLYYENGYLKYEVNINNGNLLGATQYYSNGNLKLKIKYDKNEKIILRKSYTEDWKVEVDTVNGTGIQKEYFKSGELSWEEKYINYKIAGSKQYYKGGKLAKVISFKNGKAISGWLYSPEGKKTKMTNTHFKNIGYEY